MKKLNFTLLFLCFFSIIYIGKAQNNEALFSDKSIKKVMKSVANWQLANPKHESYDWTNGAFYSGVMAAYKTTGSKKLLKAMLKMGEENQWKLGKRLRHADDHAIAQTYIDLANLENDPSYYAPFKDSLDKMMAGKPAVKGIKVIDWWWCDALFMAPPAYVKLSNATGEDKYLDYMDQLYKECYDLLYDKEENLFARDLGYVINEDGTGKREKNGEKIFWSRGNGWVMGGLVKVIEELPKDHKTRNFYIDLYKEMAKKIASIQQEDGFWKASLLDPKSYPIGESSGTGFYCYALAWGINNGMLEKAEYLPVVKKAWVALNGAVHPNGMLGYTQQIGADPRPTSKDSWEVYGAGAFLLAGSEVIKLEE
ncbi:glycoside hydrolase family 88/105 protein [Flexithrix dorotheae]|uniref:glycoside hydrolase family 88/105 protein n=1 Tax=Flexithrix dorotheae TaxID=70993 RepID=UPI000369DC0A|nr:glycoside hydrolase family 88 protein [Flexithrix dorotheae]